MAILVRRFFKVLLFAGLLLLSARYIYRPLSVISLWNQHYSIAASDFLGFKNIENFDFLFSVTVSLIMAGIEYALIMKIWRTLKRKGAF